VSLFSIVDPLAFARWPLRKSMFILISYDLRLLPPEALIRRAGRVPMDSVGSHFGDADFNRCNKINLCKNINTFIGLESSPS
jgi:hypothetical protein